MNIITEWAARHHISRAALAELSGLLAAIAPEPHITAATSEAAAQQKIRLAAPKHGVRLWRNNVGATPSRIDYNCPHCGSAFGESTRPIRYGLANDSADMNIKMKSSDLIGITPLTITPQHVGGTVGVFTAIECKRPGWQYSGNGRELAQFTFMQVVMASGGIAQFATGPDDIWQN